MKKERQLRRHMRKMRNNPDRAASLDRVLQIIRMPFSGAAAVLAMCLTCNHYLFEVVHKGYGKDAPKSVDMDDIEYVYARALVSVAKCGKPCNTVIRYWSSDKVEGIDKLAET